MKKIYHLLMLGTILFLSSCKENKNEVEREEEEHEKYDNPEARARQEFNKTVDPSLGIVPSQRLFDAMDQVIAQQKNYQTEGVTAPWEERGPTHDSVSALGNSRGQSSGAAAGTFTSGRIKAFMVDMSDPTGNTVWTAGVNGGIWKCTNFLSSTAIPDWQPITDYMSNLSVLSICQNPANPDIMYASTGEPTYISNSPRGNGLYKSIDHGVTWGPVLNASNVANTTARKYGYKVICDASGNVYHATNGQGLLRSSDGGKTWTIITPSGAGNVCTDIEISSNGKMHASFGDNGGGTANTVSYRFTANPATVTATTWTSSSIGYSGTPGKLEIEVQGDTVYGVTYSRTTRNIDFVFRSVNGGTSWTKMNSTAYSQFTNTQAWYTQCLVINPSNPDEIIIGQLDCYKSTDGGATLSQVSYWVSSGEYVHADQHSFKWWKLADGSSKLVCASDGGLYLSEDDGLNWKDKNRNLRLKQFYSCAIHPTTTNYFLAGAQDNGIHRLRSAGLNGSHEVVGGDGMYVDIDQDQPAYQFSAYVGNAFRKSTNGGTSWTTGYSNSSTGSFVNPWDYDDAQNILLAGSGNTGDFLRWNNPQSGTSITTVPLTELGTNNSGDASVGAVTVSPYTTGVAYFGSSANGVVVKVANTKTTTGSGSSDVSVITPSGAGAWYANCIAIGSDDNNLAVCYTNYGISNIWVTTDGGNSWAACDGNLPDIPVRWAVYHPTNNSAMVIGTELGVYTTTNLNGASTQWTLSPGLPLSAVYMLKLRKSDNLLCAATFGRGLWTTNILNLLPLKKITLNGSVKNENIANLSWDMVDATDNAKFVLEYSEDGINFKTIARSSKELSKYSYNINKEIGYFRVMGFEPGSGPVYSNIVALKTNKTTKGLQIEVAPNPINANGKILLSSSNAGEYTWQICNVQGSVLHIGRGSLNIGSKVNIQFDFGKLTSGMYLFKATQNGQTKTTPIIKQ